MLRGRGGCALRSWPIHLKSVGQLGDTSLDPLHRVRRTDHQHLGIGGAGVDFQPEAPGFLLHRTDGLPLAPDQQPAVPLEDGQGGLDVPLWHLQALQRRSSHRCPLLRMPQHRHGQLVGLVRLLGRPSDHELGWEAFVFGLVDPHVRARLPLHADDGLASFAHHVPHVLQRDLHGDLAGAVVPACVPRLVILGRQPPAALHAGGVLRAAGPGAAGAGLVHDHRLLDHGLRLAHSVRRTVDDDVGDRRIRLIDNHTAIALLPHPFDVGSLGSNQPTQHVGVHSHAVLDLISASGSRSRTRAALQSHDCHRTVLQIRRWRSDTCGGAERRAARGSSVSYRCCHSGSSGSSWAGGSRTQRNIRRAVHRHIRFPHRASLH
mmetsp:Transcript_38849/g.101621  ORF Transcript_38849/g.101621 Transcript_38849/m.101621 type:complete len:376 (+) Transcript_38849:522-1649(+)